MVKVFTFIMSVSLMLPLYGLRIYNQTSNKVITLTSFDFSDCYLQRGSKHIFGCNKVSPHLAPGEGFIPTQNGALASEFIGCLRLNIGLTQSMLNIAKSDGKYVPESIMEVPVAWLVTGFDVIVDDEKYSVTVIDDKFSSNDDNCIVVISDGFFGAVEITKNYNQ